MTESAGMADGQVVPSIRESAATLGHASSYESTLRFYEENAESYARATLSTPMERLPAFAGLLQRGSRVVDLGCGAGRDLLAFKALGLESIGLDVSFAMSRIAQAHAQVPVVVGDLRALPFGSETFDAVWAAASLLHLARGDIPSALADMRRVLRPGGRVFVSLKRGDGEGNDRAGRWFSYYQPLEWAAAMEQGGFSFVSSDASTQSESPLGEKRSVEWFSCVATKSL